MPKVILRAFIWWSFAGILVLGDFFSKAYMLEHLRYGHAKRVLGEFLRWCLIYNHGVAFGIGSAWRGVPWWALGLIVGAVLALWLLMVPLRTWQRGLALCLILGGAIGNVVDRFLWGYVVDFIDLGYGGWRWPTFNVADMCITVGVLWLCWQTAQKS